MRQGTGVKLGPLGGTPEELLQRAESLAATFSALLGRELRVRTGPGGCTDCETFIQIDPEDPEAYLVAEHELSHPVFGTDPKMGKVFVTQRALRLLHTAGVTSTSEEGRALQPPLERTIHAIWNVLEDWRCVSLWSELYPGGGDLLQERWRVLAEREMADSAKAAFLPYLMRTAAGIATPDAPQEFHDCAPFISAAAAQVRGADALACLAICGKLIDDVAKVLVPPPTPPPKAPKPRGAPGGQGNGASKAPARKRPKATGKKRGTNAKQQARKQRKKQVERLAGAADRSPTPSGIGANDTRTSRTSRKSVPDAALLSRVGKVETALKSDKRDPVTGKTPFEVILDDGNAAMQKRLADARAAMGTVHKTRKQINNEKFMGSFRVAKIPAHRVTPSRPLPAPTSTGSAMRKDLEKLRMRRKYRLAEEGDDVDTEEYLEAMLNGELDDARVFLDVKRESGMELLLLGDVSGSMLGWGIDALDYATADIKAAAGTHIKVLQWGFSNEVFVFTKNGSFRDVPDMRNGGTYLVQAVDAAVEWARASKTERAIILLTDGYPTSLRGRKSTGEAILDMRNVLTEAKADGIVLSVLAIGSASSKDIYDRAFGAKNYGHVTNKITLGNALRDAAQALLKAHIKRRMR